MPTFTRTSGSPGHRASNSPGRNSGRVNKTTVIRPRSVFSLNWLRDFLRRCNPLRYLNSNNARALPTTKITRTVVKSAGLPPPKRSAPLNRPVRSPKGKPSRPKAPDPPTPPPYVPTGAPSEPLPSPPESTPPNSPPQSPKKGPVSPPKPPATPAKPPPKSPPKSPPKPPASPPKPPPKSPPKSPPKPPSKPSPDDKSLYKRNGRLVRGGRVVIPQRVLEGGILKRFPTLNSPLSRGLWNQGNFCYRNATLQALLHVPGFYRYMGMLHKDCRKRSFECVVCALQHLAHVYWEMGYQQMSKEGAVRGPLSSIKDVNLASRINPPKDLALSDLREEFRNQGQGDSWDFLQYLMQDIRDKELSTDSRTFDEMFQLQMERYWKCGECGTETTKPGQESTTPADAGMSLSIGDPGASISLTQCLDLLLRPTPVHIRCESSKCLAKHPERNFGGLERDQIFRITQTPEVLMIRLDRFVHHAGRDAQGKLIESEVKPIKQMKRVHFDEYLDVGRWTKEGKSVRYRLDTVVGHMGATIKSGHNIAAVRECGGHKFIAINDDTAIGPSAQGQGTIRELQRPTSFGLEAEPYILIYTKDNEDGEDGGDAPASNANDE